MPECERDVEKHDRVGNGNGENVRSALTVEFVLDRTFGAVEHGHVRRFVPSAGSTEGLLGFGEVLHEIEEDLLPCFS